MHVLQRCTVFWVFFAQTYTLTVIRVRCEKIDVCEVGLDNQVFMVVGYMALCFSLYLWVKPAAFDAI